MWVHSEPTDMRKSFNTLSALVTEQMQRQVLNGDLFVFISRNRKRIKTLHFDGTGLVVCAKRLERGQFDVLSRISASYCFSLSNGLPDEFGSCRDAYRSAQCSPIATPLASRHQEPQPPGLL